MRTLPIVVTFRSREHLERRAPPCSSSRIGWISRGTRVATSSRPRYMFRDDVEVVAEREILVDGLDPEPRRVARRVDLYLLSFEEDLALVGHVRPGDALDQRGLAGTVVAHERDHLARVDVEVDERQRLHRSEALGDAAQLRGSVGGRGGRPGCRPPYACSARPTWRATCRCSPSASPCRPSRGRRTGS